MTLEEQNKLALRIHKYITHIAKVTNLKTTFRPVRRKSDLLIVRLGNEYQHAHNIATYLPELFPEIDTEIPQSLQLDNYLTLIVTQKLADQEVVAKERRAKLLSVVGKESRVSNQLITEDESYYKQMILSYLTRKDKTTN